MSYSQDKERKRVFSFHNFIALLAPFWPSGSAFDQMLVSIGTEEDPVGTPDEGFVSEGNLWVLQAEDSFRAGASFCCGLTR